MKTMIYYREALDEWVLAIKRDDKYYVELIYHIPEGWWGAYRWVCCGSLKDSGFEFIGYL